MNILFVCTGNTCRSPMAQAMFEQMADDSDVLRSSLEIGSAGTFASDGAQATEPAVRVMESLYGIEMKKHRARQITPEIAEEADLILAMEASHIEEMLAICPEAEPKMSTLLGYIHGIQGFPGEGYDIGDPYKEPVEVYEECAKQIEQALQILKNILEKQIHQE